MSFQAVVRPTMALALASVALSQVAVPEQIHLFSPAVGSMHVAWATRGSDPACEQVSYGLTPSLGLSVNATSTVFTKNMTTPLRLHDVTLTGLAAANTRYYYSVGCNSTVYTFVSNPSRAGGKMYLVLADLGVVNDVALSAMVQAGAAGAFDAVLHSGDFAYDLEDDGGENGNTFMNMIQPIASTYSYTVAPGNHEADADDSFSQYQARFAGVAATVGATSGSNTSLYYSYNDGLVHFTVIDTEQFYYDPDPNGVNAQYAWLAADLAAVDRSVTPWIIVLAHKSYYMKKTDFTEYLDLFHQYGVDLALAGHQHNYNRLYPIGAQGVAHPECVDETGPVPVYQPCDNRTVHIITGSPGCDGGIDTAVGPAGAVAQSILAYGYGMLQIVNETTAHYWWTETVARVDGEWVQVPRESAATDEAWFNRA